jgi:hypothetical protein
MIVRPAQLYYFLRVLAKDTGRGRIRIIFYKINDKTHWKFVAIDTDLMIKHFYTLYGFFQIEHHRVQHS